MPQVLASNRVPGAVVSYIKNGEVAWTKAFGVANLQTGTPMRPDMVFNHGSNGKVMTAWALMRLVQAGKVELDAPLKSRAHAGPRTEEAVGGAASPITPRAAGSRLAFPGIGGFLPMACRLLSA
jgi:CubicO group peptidase (beta-lactamase class C family)